MNQTAKSRWKPAGFRPTDHWESRFDTYVRVIQPGEFEAINSSGLILSTLLGSCVAACICDPVSGIGGLNHFLLPNELGAAGSKSPLASRYGVQAMEMLINKILKLGGERSRLEAKLFGGANVISLSSENTVGQKNQVFAQEFLRNEGIPITATDLGGTAARRVFFDPFSNKVHIKRSSLVERNQIRNSETRMNSPQRQPDNLGDVELFE